MKYKASSRRPPITPPTIKPGEIHGLEPRSARRGKTIPQTAVHSVASNNNRSEAVKWERLLKVSLPFSLGER